MSFARKMRRCDDRKYMSREQRRRKWKGIVFGISEKSTFGISKAKFNQRGFEYVKKILVERPTKPLERIAN